MCKFRLFPSKYPARLRLPITNGDLFTLFQLVFCFSSSGTSGSAQRQSIRLTSLSEKPAGSLNRVNHTPGARNKTYKIQKHLNMTNPSLTLRALIAAVALLIGSATAQDQPTTETPRVPIEENPVVLTVDGTPIMANDVREMMMARFGQQMQQMPPEQLAMVQEQVQNMIIGDLVSKTLLLNEAKKEGYKATDEDIEKSLAEISKKLPEGATLDEFAAKGGVSLDRIKAQITDDTVIRQLIEKVTADTVAPDDAAVKKYFEEHPDEFKKDESVQASHILVSTQGITDEAELAAKLASVETIKEQLAEGKGENFAELAAQHSDCPSKAQGGDLGQFARGQMVPEFEEAAFTQEVGAVGDTIKTQFGYHIIKVTERTDAEQVDFAEVKEQLSTNLFDKAKSDKVESYIGELQSKAKIDQPGAAAAETPEGAAPEAPATEAKADKKPEKKANKKADKKPEAKAAE